MINFTRLKVLLFFSTAFFFSSEGQSLIEPIPFQYHQGLIFLEITSKHNDTLFCLFDTGAERSAIDNNTAEELELKVIDTTHLTGTNATIKTPVVRMYLLKMGNHRKKTLEPTSRDLSHSLSPNNRKLDMVLGYDFFEHTIVKIDFAASLLYILKNPAGIGCESYTPFTLDHNIPRFTGTANGSVKMDFRMDTGANLFETEDVYINITKRDWDALRKENPDLKPEFLLTATGINDQPLSLPVARLDKIVLGDFEIERPYVIAQPEQGYFASPEAVGFVSNNLLKRYRCLAIDYIHNRLYYSQ